MRGEQAVSSCLRSQTSPRSASAQVVDFHWNPAEPFTLMSVADDSALDKGGGTLQLWRISDLVTRPEEEVLAELEPHRCITCCSRAAQQKINAVQLHFTHRRVDQRDHSDLQTTVHACTVTVWMSSRVLSHQSRASSRGLSVFA